MDQNLGIATAGVPTIIIGNHALVGEDQIRDQLVQVIIEEQALPAGEANGTVNITAAKNCPDLCRAPFRQSVHSARH